MRNYIRQTTIMKLSDFLANESGKVGAKNAFVMGAVVSAAAIAQMMFASKALATLECSPPNCTQGADYCCCSFFDAGGAHHKHCTLRAYCQFNLMGTCAGE